MTRAVAIPYSVDQNEPSRPLKQVIDLPDDEVVRNKVLKKLFVEHVCDVQEDDLTIEIGSEDDFGDIIVNFDDTMYLYVTFVEV